MVIVYADGFDPFFGDTSIDPGQVTTFDVWLIRGGVPSGPSLRGHVYQNTFYPTFAPVPVPGARVVLQTEPIPGTDPPGVLFETQRGGTGYYEFAEIPAGRMSSGPPLKDSRHRIGYRSGSRPESHIPGCRPPTDLLGRGRTLWDGLFGQPKRPERSTPRAPGSFGRGHGQAGA